MLLLSSIKASSSSCLIFKLSDVEVFSSSSSLTRLSLALNFLARISRWLFISSTSLILSSNVRINCSLSRCRESPVWLFLSIISARLVPCAWKLAIVFSLSFSWVWSFSTQLSASTKPFAFNASVVFRSSNCLCKSETSTRRFSSSSTKCNFSSLMRFISLVLSCKSLFILTFSSCCLDNSASLACKLAVRLDILWFDFVNSFNIPSSRVFDFSFSSLIAFSTSLSLSFVISKRISFTSCSFSETISRRLFVSSLCLSRRIVNSLDKDSVLSADSSRYFSAVLSFSVNVITFACSCDSRVNSDCCSSLATWSSVFSSLTEHSSSLHYGRKAEKKLRKVSDKVLSLNRTRDSTN